MFIILQSQIWQSYPNHLKSFFSWTITLLPGSSWTPKKIIYDARLWIFRSQEQLGRVNLSTYYGLRRLSLLSTKHNLPTKKEIIFTCYIVLQPKYVRLMFKKRKLEKKSHQVTNTSFHLSSFQQDLWIGWNERLWRRRPYAIRAYLKKSQSGTQFISSTKVL